jgi:hypothetical protein
MHRYFVLYPILKEEVELVGVGHRRDRAVVGWTGWRSRSASASPLPVEKVTRIYNSSG